MRDPGLGVVLADERPRFGGCPGRCGVIGHVLGLVGRILLGA